MRTLLPLLLACACNGGKDDTGADAPLGMILAQDGVTYAGAATVDVTPAITETFTDLDGDGSFDGCLDTPAGGTEDCPEPFDDLDGDGFFDAVFIAGFGEKRIAREVHDPITARALVLSRNGAYLALVGVDVIGLTSDRTHAARDQLVAEGFDGDRLLVSSLHNHEGPDTVGMWGDLSDLGNVVPGFDPAYQQALVDGIAQAVRDAAGAMEAVDLTVGAVHLRDRDPWFNSAAFGGKNPGDMTVGLIHDIRDPLIISDQVLALQGTGTDGDVVFTLTSFSSHPETWADANTSLSADWPGAARAVLEARYGGVALHVPESLGGMQSVLGAQVPLVDEDGVHAYQACDEAAVADPSDTACFGQDTGAPRLDAEGDPVPAWATPDTWDYVRSVGWHVAEGAIAALEAGEPLVADPLRVEVETAWVPITNVGFQLLAQAGIFDMQLSSLSEDPTLCPDDDALLGCMEMRTFRVQVGDLGLVSVPGEVFPELAWGVPTGDPTWDAEYADPAARGAAGIWFPRHDADCDAVGWEACVDDDAVGDCDCLSVHAWPYDPVAVGQAPLLDALDTKYRAILGITDGYGGYVVPAPDFNTWVSAFSDQGDHYEETNSVAEVFADRLIAAQEGISARW